MELVAVILEFTVSMTYSPQRMTETHSREDEWKEKEREGSGNKPSQIKIS